MAEQQLQQNFDVDLSSLDAKLKQEEVLWRTIEERSEVTERKLKKQKLDLSDLERRAESFGGRFRRVGKGILQDIVGNTLLDAVPGLNQGVVGRGANLAADAAFGGLGAAGIVVAGIMTAISEIKNQIEIAKDRDKKIEAYMEERIDNFNSEITRIEIKFEKERREQEEFNHQLEMRMRSETQELLYQSSQYLEE